MTVSAIAWIAGAAFVWLALVLLVWALCRAAALGDRYE
jgi:hypothetical protein